MGAGARLQRWWDRLLGRPPWYRDGNLTTSRTDLYGGAPPAKKPAGPGELSLVDDDEGAKKRRRQRSAGVDPYSNDGGFTKPRAWDRKERD